MSEIKVSIFASAVRPRLWPGFFKSLESTTESCEVVFAGPIDCKIALSSRPASFQFKFTFIETANIKPAQCYEIARRACVGETISWSADDCEYSPDCFGKAYRYWKSLGNEKVALSIQTIEDGYKYNMGDHSFVGFNRATPLMAPVALLSRKVCEETGGFDRRFVAGQYENKCCLDLYEVGGSIIIFDEGYCSIDHQKKHLGEHKFRAGYTKDRQVLESIYGKRAELLHTGKSLKHEPYSSKDILTKSQSNNMPSLWV